MELTQISNEREKLATGQSVTQSPALPALNDYLNYRLYLKDFYEFKRRQNTGLRAYSYSVFSAAADIRSPNYLKLIIEGKRNLSDDMIARFSKALQHNKNEAGEFRLLVQYGQETDPLRRNHILRDLADIRVDQKLRSGELDRAQWERVPNWVSWVLYTMVDQQGVDFAMDKLKQALRGKVSEEEIRIAMGKLTESGQLIRAEAGNEASPLKKNENPGGVDEVPVALVRKLQAELNYLGMESIFEDAPTEREVGALTLALTAEEFEKYRFELRQLRKRIHKEIAVKRQNSKGERVYQLNLQLFPITDKLTDKLQSL